MNQNGNAGKVFAKADVVVVGTGPAGAAAAVLLATYGVDVLVVSKFAWTARTPRSHITNQRTMEVFRDLGLEQEAIALATPHDLMGENPYCISLTGPEFGRRKTWGTPPERASDYATASPTSGCDLPQNLLEPMLVTEAAHRGARIRFDTEYVGLEQDDEGVTVEVHDRLTGENYAVRCAYLIGADGANSKVLGDVDLSLEGKMGVSGSINIVFDCDLSKYVEHRPSVLYWIVQPGSEAGGMGIGVVRMVRPWYRWLAIWNYDVDAGPPKLSEAHAERIVRQMIGDAEIPIRIDSTSTWTVNEMYATQLSRGRVFCMGDAVHRHPPLNGLGSNVSIQDAFNLSWKLAHVLRGEGGPALLDTYSMERAPVAMQTAKRANKSLSAFPPIFEALMVLDSADPEQLKSNMMGLQDASSAAAARRKALREAMEASDYVYNTHGVEMNQRYASRAVVPDGSPDPGFNRDEELYYQMSSRPGCPVPHAWLLEAGNRISTLDLCGHGRFTLLTGLLGEPWADAATEVARKLGVRIVAHIIGFGRRYEDGYGDAARLLEIEEDGALLIRPDNIVGWRVKRMPVEPARELSQALASILSLDGRTSPPRRDEQNERVLAFSDAGTGAT